MSFFLGIDTSNYTTSTALYCSETNVMKQCRKILPVKKGQLGLRQSDAVFHHTSQLHDVFRELTSEFDCAGITAIGVSTRPRPAEGSYMPCFSVGKNTADILASALKVPLYGFSHQEGHIAAALFSAKRFDLFCKKFLAFHVSGGTTEAVIADGRGDSFKIQVVAKSLDLHAGQAVDRTGLMLGLGFPCGAELERLALKNSEKTNPKPTLKGLDCCLSGVENQCRRLLENGNPPEFVAAYCLKYIENTISLMTDRIFEKYGKMPVVYAGGVMSDSLIKNSLEEKYNAVFAESALSSDNAAGTAYLAYRKFENVHT